MSGSCTQICAAIHFDRGKGRNRGNGAKMLFSREMSHLHLFLIWTRLALSTLALTIDEFYQFVPNMTLPQGDDIVSRVTLAQPFLFYGIGYQTVYVS